MASNFQKFILSVICLRKKFKRECALKHWLRPVLLESWDDPEVILFEIETKFSAPIKTVVEKLLANP